MATINRTHKLIHGYWRLESGDMNIIDGIILIIIQYQRSAKWSREFKGRCIKLSEEDSKASLNGEDMEDEDWTEGQSVRADFGIHRGEVVSWELECKIMSLSCNFLGVISSEQTDFDVTPEDGMKDSWGVDDQEHYVYKGQPGVEDFEWGNPGFPLREVFTLKMTADWTQKQCKLNIFYDGKRLNEGDDCSLTLSEIDDKFMWYPCVTPYNKGAYCVIRYA